MPVQIGAEAVQHLATELVVLPLLREELQKALVLEVSTATLQPVQVELEKGLELVVEVTADDLCTLAAHRRVALARLGQDLVTGHRL